VIRTEPLPVAAVRAEPQLRNAFGFTWNLADPDNTISALAVVRAEVEDRFGRVSRVVLRAGQLYEYREPVERVWFTCAAPGVLSLDVAYEEGDKLVPTPPPAPDVPRLIRREAEFVSPVGWSWSDGILTSPQYSRPPGASRCTVWSRWAPYSSNAPRWLVFIDHPETGEPAAAPTDSVQPWQSGAADGFVLPCVSYGPGHSTPGVGVGTEQTFPVGRPFCPEKLRIKMAPFGAFQAAAGKTFGAWVEWWR
jgi:hypothetical protein